ncbi:MAG: hypothetical protein GY865_17530 [candidate division Zixibacteria bacterium]|nr:hypothetical protein [candidate division Zixibacteria bacterium]
MDLRYRLYYFLNKLSSILPAWLFKFNKGTVYSTDDPHLRIRKNTKYLFDRVQDKDIEELSEFSGFSIKQLRERFQAGNIGIISRLATTQKIKTIQWAHMGEVFIRGFNLKLDIPANAAYFFWTYSSPDVRITGIINTSFKIMISALDEENIKEYYALVEFWNKGAHMFHHRLKFKEVMSVLYIKILFLNITFKKHLESKKIGCDINIFRMKNVDII